MVNRNQKKKSLQKRDKKYKSQIYDKILDKNKKTTQIIRKNWRKNIDKIKKSSVKIILEQYIDNPFEKGKKSNNYLYSYKGIDFKNDRIKNKRINQNKNIRIENSIQFKNILVIIQLLLIFSLLQLLSSYTCYSIVFHLSTITLKVKGTGERQVLGYYDSSYKFDSKDYPNEIYINGIKQNEVKLKYNFNQTDNHVVFIWNNSIKNCYEMFSNCQYITEIDFSNFDTSTVTTIDFMFFGCKSLEYINIQNSTDIKFAQLKVD